VTNAAFSNLRGTRLNANAPGGFVTYNVTNLRAGDYRISVGADAGAERGRFQLACGPSGGALTKVGGVQDTYSATNMVYLLPIHLYTPTNLIILWTNLLKEFDCGTWEAPSNGNYQFQFTALDKNPGSTGYALVLDYIKLTPVTGPAVSRPLLSATGYPGEAVLTWPTNAAGFLLECATNLASTAWMPVSPAPVPVGEWAVVTNTTDGDERYYRLRKP
jgi:hypothetical protein